jgi:hypothetical protein
MIFLKLDLIYLSDHYHQPACDNMIRRASPQLITKSESNGTQNPQSISFDSCLKSISEE